MRSVNLSIPLAVVLTACATSETPRPTGPVQVQTTEENVVPAGTRFAIEVDESIDTDQPVTERTFGAHFAQAIVDQDGETIIPQGSPAELVVVQVGEAGAFETPTLSLAIQSVTVNGREYAISTPTLERKGEEGVGVNPRTGAFVGGGALLGTVVGGVVGGVEGAILGGVLGGLAGGGVQVLTRGDQVQVPAGTILEFELDEPWRLIPREELRPMEEPIS